MLRFPSTEVKLQKFRYRKRQEHRWFRKNPNHIRAECNIFERTVGASIPESTTMHRTVHCLISDEEHPLTTCV
jgi:hypothetical protein